MSVHKGQYLHTERTKGKNRKNSFSKFILNQFKTSNIKRLFPRKQIANKINEAIKTAIQNQIVYNNSAQDCV
jgi:hypothetical protein